MVYTEIKIRNRYQYYYRCKTVREHNQFRKQRIYLGKNLNAVQLQKREQSADTKLQRTKLPEEIKEDHSWLYYSAVIVPHLNSPVIEAYQRLRRKYPQYTLEWYFTFYSKEGDSSGWILSAKDQSFKSSLLFNNISVLKLLFQEWKKKAERYYKAINLLQKRGIRDLETDYASFIKIYIQEYAPALIIESFYSGLDLIITNLIEKYPSYKEAINFLIEPYKKSFHQEEQESLLHLALLIKKGDSNQKIMKELRDHRDRFFWMQNNYKYTDPISITTFHDRARDTAERVKDIEKRIITLRNYEQIRRKKKQKILASLPLTAAEKRILHWCSILSWWQDQRKKANLIGDYLLNNFLEKIARQYGYSLIELQHADIPEVLRLFKGKKIPPTLLSQRMRASMHYVDPRGQAHFLTGQEAKALKEKLIPEKKTEKVTDLRGSVGSIGLAQGKVRIIKNPRKSSINQGEILVTGMTRPEFVPLMKKAAAIVTDEGGVTSHAAIIARELGIPCLVGTKIATRILKDGDEVVVNANHGFVRIVKKAN